MNLNIPFAVFEKLKNIKEGEERSLSYEDPPGNIVSFKAFLTNDGLLQIRTDDDVNDDSRPDNKNSSSPSKRSKTSKKSNIESTKRKAIITDKITEIDLSRRYPKRTRTVKSAREILSGSPDVKTGAPKNDQVNKRPTEHVEPREEGKQDETCSTEEICENSPPPQAPPPQSCQVAPSDLPEDSKLELTSIAVAGTDSPSGLSLYVPDTRRRRSKVERLNPEQHLQVGETDCTVFTDEKILDLLDSVKPTAALEDYCDTVESTSMKSGVRRQLQCKQCNNLSDNKKEFAKHLKTHMAWTPWHCPRCEVKYEYRAQLARHIYAHSAIKPYQCGICEKAFIYKQKLQLHMKYHYNQKDILCSFCDAGFQERKLLYRHIEKKHPDKALLVKKSGKRRNWKFDESAYEAPNDPSNTNTIFIDIHVKKEDVEPGLEPPIETNDEDESNEPRSEDAHDIQEVHIQNNTEVQNEDEISIEINNDTIHIQIEKDDDFVEEDNGGDDDSIPDTRQDEQTTAIPEETEGVSSKKTYVQQRIRFQPYTLPPGLEIYCTKELLRGRTTVFKCIACEYKTPNPSELINHLLAEHPDAKPYMCLKCDYRSRHRSTVYQHQKSHSQDKSHQCTQCGKTFKFKTSLISHVNNHNNLRSWKCTECDMSFNNRYNMNCHKKRMHELVKQEICEECGKSFKTPRDLVRHQESHRKERLLPCKFCDKKYKTRATLYMHSKSHTIRFYCSICDKNLTSYSSFLLHKRSHEPDFKGYKCKECDHVFLSSGNLSNHRKLVHSDLRPYPCDFEQCTQKFKTVSHLRRHMLVHNNEKKFQCNVCSVNFKRKETLNKHMFTHQLIKPYICSMCTAQYTQQAALERHVAVKHGGREYKCSECGLSFKSYSYFVKHCFKMHPPAEANNTAEEYNPDSAVVVTGKKQNYLVCDQCQKLFTSQQSLVMHVLTEHMGQKWVGGMGLVVATNPDNEDQQNEQNVALVAMSNSDELHAETIGDMIEIGNNVVVE